jgi:hypothetical protein
MLGRLIYHVPPDYSIRSHPFFPDYSWAALDSGYLGRLSIIRSYQIGRYFSLTIVTHNAFATNDVLLDSL